MRMGSEIPKQFLLLNEKPVLMHTLQAFYSYDQDMKIILVLPQDHQGYWKSLCEEFHFQIKHQIADGGVTRFHSVKNGLKYIEDNSIVAIHDGVRPLVSRKIIADAFEAANQQQAAYPVIPVVDTLRQFVSPDKSEIVNRNLFCLVQTPQVFTSEVIIDAYEVDYSEKFTDDISVVEAKGNCTPVMISGERENIKITTSIDILIAEALLK